MENENAFKNWINPSVVKKMGDVFHEVFPAFNQKRFQKISSRLNDFELKGRVLLLTEGLKAELPGDFEKAAKIIQQVLEKKKLKSFELWPVSEYISQFGINHFDDSLELMYQLTQQFTSEFAVRPFLQKNPEAVLKKFKAWLKDENVHIRRWISEGTRPILPWGGKIPSFIRKPATLHLLEALRYDEELYVRKSVANHLNDISKHHPELVVKTLQEWEQVCPPKHQEKIQWIKKQALRTLIKNGDQKALSLMGVSRNVYAEISILKLNKKSFVLGDNLEFSFILESKSKNSQDLIIDYAIGFVKANGQVSDKVFKLKRIELKGREKQVVSKKHSLKRITTMTFYPGKHSLKIQINGKVLAETNFNFTV